MKLPAQGKKDAGFHLVQTNLPYFMSGTPYEVPKGGLKSIELHLNLEFHWVFWLKQPV